MIKDITKILKEGLTQEKELGIIETLEGLTRVFEYYPTNDTKTKRIPFPVDCIEPVECDECQELTICVPSNEKRSIVL